MKVIWSEQAIRGWSEVAEYIFRDFGEQGLIRFKKLTQECVSAIIKFPNSGSIEWNDSSTTTIYRYHIINKRSKMLYFVDDDTAYIADFWDLRSSH